MSKQKKIKEFLDSVYKENANRVSGKTAVCELFGENKEFAILCRKCGSVNITIQGELGVTYGEYTGYCAGTTVIKCIDCGTAVTVDQ